MCRVAALVAQSRQQGINADKDFRCYAIYRLCVSARPWPCSLPQLQPQPLFPRLVLLLLLLLLLMWLLLLLLLPLLPLLLL